MQGWHAHNTLCTSYCSVDFDPACRVISTIVKTLITWNDKIIVQYTYSYYDVLLPTEIV